MNQLTGIPDNFIAGNPVKFSVKLPDYLPSENWQLRFRLLWQSGEPVEINTTSENDFFNVVLSSDETKDWQSGNASLIAIVKKDNDSLTVAINPVTVSPNLATASAFDTRSENRRALDAAEKALLKYIAGGRAAVEEYDIAGRRIKFRSVDELKALIAYYRAEVAREVYREAALHGGSPGRIVTRH